ELRNRRIRFGLAGCGRIADRHFDAFQHHADRAELAAVCDVDCNALEGAVERTGAKGFESFSTMLSGTELDCVVLATPSGLHAPQTIEAAAAARHVVTEKPMATRWRDGLAMVHACDEAYVRLFVVKQNRRNPTIQLLKRGIDQGRFGRI